MHSAAASFEIQVERHAKESGEHETLVQAQRDSGGFLASVLKCTPRTGEKMRYLTGGLGSAFALAVALMLVDGTAEPAACLVGECDWGDPTEEECCGEEELFSHAQCDEEEDACMATSSAEDECTGTWGHLDCDEQWCKDGEPET